MIEAKALAALGEMPDNVDIEQVLDDAIMNISHSAANSIDKGECAPACYGSLTDQIYWLRELRNIYRGTQPSN